MDNLDKHETAADCFYFSKNVIGLVDFLMNVATRTPHKKGVK